MISVEDARRIVLDWSRPLPFRRVPLAEALDTVLAEHVVSSIDLPPFDKALVDGYAVRASDCATDGQHRFMIGEEILAGSVPLRRLAHREAAVIMTGAPLPDGADAVVMHEKTRALDDGTVAIPGPVATGVGRMTRGRELQVGQVLFRPGEALDAIGLGVLASVGKSDVYVNPRPRVAILTTGDELVPPDETPGPGQIRETNSIVLAGLVRTLLCEAIVYPTAPDEPTRLRAAIAHALSDRPDVLLICGGVSAGRRDLVPEALAANEVRTLFHKVRLKPGKPLLFGVVVNEESRAGPSEVVDALAISSRSTSAANGAERLPHETCLTQVFGLPGNPVSGIVGFLLFVAPSLLRMASGGDVLGDVPDRDLRREFRHLSAPYRHRGDRPTYHPARREYGSVGEEFRDQVRPLAWAGSSDLFTISQADGFAHFPAGDRDYEFDEQVEFLAIPSPGNVHLGPAVRI